MCVVGCYEIGEIELGEKLSPYANNIDARSTDSWFRNTEFTI